jgi:hypothetical protein
MAALKLNVDGIRDRMAKKADIAEIERRSDALSGRLETREGLRYEFAGSEWAQSELIHWRPAAPKHVFITLLSDRCKDTIAHMALTQCGFTSEDFKG